MKTNSKIERFQIDEVSSGYARMVRYGNLVFLSGIGGRDVSQDSTYTKDGVSIVENLEKGYAPTIEEQTELIFKRWKIYLEKAGTNLDNVIKSQIFLTDIRDLPKVQRVMEKYWTKNPPCFSAYGGVQFGRPNMRAEFEILAVIPE